VPEHSVLQDLLVLLLAPVAIVPLFRRLRSSPIIGYLVAGIVIGPHALGLIGDVEEVRFLAELGVAFLLFAIGLELSFERLKVMRRLVFGLGGIQVFITSVLIAAAAVAVGEDIAAAVVIGGALALSSTAFVLQLLVERGEQVSRHGRAAFSILLFQDLAVVPLLALLPLLAPGQRSVLGALGLAGIKAVVALAAILVIGRFVLRPVFRAVAEARSSELFVSATLLVVVGIGWVTVQAGLSLPLGAFLAGVLLSESEYRHQVEADIRPFRGLLLGLFFMTVGLGMDLGVMADAWARVLVLLALLLVVKALLIGGLCRAFGLSLEDAVRVGPLLAQGGEFGFLILTSAMAFEVVAVTTSQVLMATIALSMILTPFLADLGALLSRRIRPRPEGDLQALRSEAGELSGHVVIAGFGRVGQTVGKVLAAAGVPYLALDLDAARVARCRAQGLPAYFGDASRFDVLAAAGAGRARAAVITMDQPAAVDRAVAALRQHFPELRIFVRGRDLRHGRQLEKWGATAVVPEAIEASLQLGSVVLGAMGRTADDADRVIEGFRREGYAGLEPVGGDSGPSA